jgi:thiol-disulfide isomerase/thioredoxin
MKTITLFITLLFTTVNLNAQEQPFKGLQKLSDTNNNKEINVMMTPNGVMINNNIIPVYDQNEKKIDPEKVFEVIRSGYYLELYEDKHGNIKAAKLEEQTAEEKKAFKETMEKAREKMIPKGELINKPLPELEFTDLEGNFYNLAALKGKVVVLNFWFISCKPCVIEIPELNEIVEHFKGQKEVVFLAFAKDNPEKLEAFLSKKPYQYKIIPNSKPFFQQLGIDSFPTHIIIDQESIIRFHQTSYTPDTKQTLITQIEKQLQ